MKKDITVKTFLAYFGFAMVLTIGGVTMESYSDEINMEVLRQQVNDLKEQEATIQAALIADFNLTAEQFKKFIDNMDNMDYAHHRLLYDLFTDLRISHNFRKEGLDYITQASDGVLRLFYYSSLDKVSASHRLKIAQEYMNKAAAELKKVADTTFNTGVANQNTQEIEKAIRLYETAVSLGNTDAAEILKRVAAHLESSNDFYQQIQDLENREKTIQAALIADFSFPAERFETFVNTTHYVYLEDHHRLLLYDLLSKLRMSNSYRKTSIDNQKNQDITYPSSLYNQSTENYLQAAQNEMNQATAELKKLADTTYTTGLEKQDFQEIERAIRLYAVAVKVGNTDASKTLEQATAELESLADTIYYNKGLRKLNSKERERATQLYAAAAHAGSRSAAQKLIEMNMDAVSVSPSPLAFSAAGHSCQTALAGF